VRYNSGMAQLINLLVMATLFFAGMAQSGALSKPVGFGIAGAAGALAMVLAIVRYLKSKQGK
jgi:hypothetical protein